MSWHASRYHGHRERPADSDSTHHRKPRSIGGGNDDRNLSSLSVSKHRAWHTITQNWDVYRIARELNERYIDPDYELVVFKKV